MSRIIRESNLFLTHDDDYFCFDAYGVSREEFNAYVEDVKINGFTVDGYDSSNYYYAENIDGIEADIDYSAVEEAISVVLRR